MKILIEIENDIYEHAKDTSEDSYDEFTAMRAIANGTPLPEHHGRLIDADRLMRVDHIILESQVDNAPTIIEATEEVQE